MVLRIMCMMFIGIVALPLSGCVAGRNSMAGLMGGAAIPNVIQQHPGSSRVTNTLLGAALGFTIGLIADQKKSNEQQALIDSGTPFRYMGNQGQVLMYVPRKRFVNAAGEECREYSVHHDFTDGPLAGKTIFCKAKNARWAMTSETPVNQVPTIRQ